MGLTGQSFTQGKETKHIMSNSFAKSQNRNSPVVSLSKVPTVTVASNAFSVGQHEKQNVKAKQSDEFLL